MAKYVFKPYSALFPELFKKEKSRLTSCLKSALAIEHVGSTAILDLGGKGIIDIAIAVDKKDMDSASVQLQSLGYEYRPSFSTSDRFYFVGYLPDPEEKLRRYHIHLTHLESRDWQGLIAFRDYLRNHPDEAQKYADIKKKAAVEADQDGGIYRKLKEPMFERISALIAQKRPKISIYIAMSLDGFIARQDGSLDWLERVHGFEDDYGYQSFFQSIEALVFGRKTYEAVCRFPEWPYKGKRVFVVSRSLHSAENEAELFSGDPANLIAKLQSENIKHAWIDGGVTVSNFLNLQAVDQLILSVIPVILGSGIPLFSGIDKDISCRLLSSQSYPSGLVQLRYEIENEKKSNRQLIP